MFNVDQFHHYLFTPQSQFSFIFLLQHPMGKVNSLLFCFPISLPILFHIPAICCHHLESISPFTSVLLFTHTNPLPNEKHLTAYLIQLTYSIVQKLWERNSTKFAKFWAFRRKMAKFCSPRKFEENSTNFPTAHCFSQRAFSGRSSCLLLVKPDFSSENALFSNLPSKFLAKMRSLRWDFQ